MNTCFVVQPFDGDVYDKRYEAVFAPGIKAAGLVPALVLGRSKLHAPYLF